MKDKWVCNAFLFHEEIQFWGGEKTENTQTEMQGIGLIFNFVEFIW